VGEKSENHQDMMLIVEAQYTAQTMALLPQVFSQSVPMCMQPLCTYILLHCKMFLTSLDQSPPFICVVKLQMPTSELALCIYPC